MLHSNCKLPFIFTYIRTLEKHMAYRKKYKALILKQVPCILKYMPYIFRLFKWLKNNVLKNRKNQPFPNDVWAILFRIAACIIQGFRHNRVAKQ